jgi:mannose-6-phosphate isomerase
MERLEGPVRPYAWGSRTSIAALQGRPVPSDGPEAELWLGAHPDSPAVLPRPGGAVSLPDLIAAQPAAMLGEAALARFGPRLPFLLKVLAAAQPLSLQAHPDAARAREAYAAGQPSYRDGYAKPELLVAVTEFDALCGFRDPVAAAAELAGLGVAALAPVVAALGAGELRGAVEALLAWPERDRAELVGAVAAAAAAGAGGPDPAGLAVDLAARYPADVGVVVALLLNRVRLQPGEAVWMPAGNLHAYLSGTGVEIMAASDNVLRGGLTPKPVDVPELLRVLRVEVLADPVVAPVPLAPGLVTWPVPVEEFALFRARVAGTEVAVPAPGPRIALCLAGAVLVADGAAEVRLGPGQAAVGPAGAKPLAVSGEGEAYVATTGLR